MAIELSIMIEGQDGLTWERWQRLVRAAEDLGFAGIYRSDHFSNPNGPYKDALETWLSLGWVADNTERIAFGTLVSPVSFRNPSILAWQASAIDDLAGGRLRLGLGAGWQDREHSSFGFPLGNLDERFQRLEEALIVIRQLTRSNEPTSFTGDYFSISDAYLQPRSPRTGGGPAIVIGGNGPRRTLPLVAKYADEWNAVGLVLADFVERASRLDQLLDEQGRERSSVKRTLMVQVPIGRDEAHLATRYNPETIARQRERGGLVGTPSELVEQLGRYAEAGIQGVQLQLWDQDDIEGLELFASEVIPQLS